MKIIGVDVDGVLADFNPAYMNRIIYKTGRDLFGPNFNITTWNYPESVGYTNEEIKSIWNSIKEDPVFWSDLGHYTGTLNVLNCLKDFQNVYFITQRTGVTAKKQTEKWLSNRYFPNPTVIVSGEKGACCKALGITHYIDDKTENCMDVKYQSPLTQCYMLARGWNTSVEGVPRIDNMFNFLGALYAS